MIISTYIEVKNKKDWALMENTLHKAGYAFFTGDIIDKTLEEFEAELEGK